MSGILWIDYIDWSCGEPDEPQPIDLKANENGDLEISIPGGQGVVLITKDKFNELARMLMVLQIGTEEVSARSITNSTIITGSGNVIS